MGYAFPCLCPKCSAWPLCSASPIWWSRRRCRATEPEGGFLRANDPAAGRWYSRDVAAIAKARRLGAVAPFFIDADAAPNPGGYPVGGLTVVAFRNNHLIYALTWFALAMLCAAAAVLVLRQPRRR